MILIFDLDDTLYPELTYVHSGFDAVARFLEKEYRIPPGDSLPVMHRELEQNGRGSVFDIVLEKYNLYSARNVGKCLKAYRFHTPVISLHEDAVEVLERNQASSQYLVTDGNKIVQGKKVAALKLGDVFKKVFITHRFGVDKAKPNPYCFLKISEIERAEPANIVYVGDNPRKDFVEIKKLGFRTVRVKRGMFKDLVLSREYEADICVNDLREIDFEKL